MNTSIEIRLVSSPLFFAEAPAGYPNKNSNNRKTESARGTMGRGKRRESLPYNAFKMAPNFFFFLSFSSSLSPSHRPPRALFFPLSSPLYDTKRPLQRIEYLVAIYEFFLVKRLGFGWRLNWTPIFPLGTSLNWGGEHDKLTWNSSK